MQIHHHKIRQYFLRNFMNKFILLLIITPLYAQSLDSLLQEAAHRNPRLLSWQGQIRASEYREKSAASLAAPTLGIEFSQVPFDSYDLWNNSLSNNLSFGQMFHLGGKRTAMRKVEQWNTTALQHGYADERNMILSDIAMAYYQLWLLDRKIDLQKNAIELLRLAESDNQNRLMTGSFSQADLYMLQAERSATEAQLLSLQQEHDLRLLDLNTYLGRDKLDTPIQPERELGMKEATTEPNIAATPMLQQMQSMIRMNQAMAQAGWKEKYPDLMLQAMVMRMPRGMILTTSSEMTMPERKTDYMYGVMASITLPFMPWSKNRYKAKAQEYEAMTDALNYKQTSMRQEISRQIAAAKTRRTTSLKLIQHYKDVVLPQMHKAVQSQLTALQSGSRSLSSFLQILKMSTMEEMNMYMAMADYHMAQAELQRWQVDTN
jgi:outer membrane protein, heavy metal efflux system